MIIVLEELGHARHAPTKPLKALHHLLDRPQFHPDEPSFAFISTANYGNNVDDASEHKDPVDKALMNRFIVSRTEELDVNSLEDLSS